MHAATLSKVESRFCFLDDALLCRRLSHTQVCMPRMQVCGGNAGDLRAWVAQYEGDNEAGKWFGGCGL